jgi:hypothetical protein
MLRRVALVRTKVSEELRASIIRVTRIVELGTALAVSSSRRTMLRHTEWERNSHTAFSIVTVVKTLNLISVTCYSSRLCTVFSYRIMFDPALIQILFAAPQSQTSSVCVNNRAFRIPWILKANCVRFEVFTSVTMKNTVFWDVTLFLTFYIYVCILHKLSA